jgi:methionine-rich copper-binding protein CopC
VAAATEPARAEDNVLVVTAPGVREEVERAPGFVTMAFSEVVDPSLAKMLVQDERGTNVTTGELIVEGTNMSTQLVEELPPGTYTVSYRLAGDDGAPQGGTFQFSVGPGAFTDAADRRWSGEEDEPEVLRNPDPNAVTPDPSSPARTSTAPAPPDTPAPTAPTPSPSPTSSASAGATSPAPAPAPAPTDATPGPAEPPAPRGTPGTSPQSPTGAGRLWLLLLGTTALAGLAAVGSWLVRRPSGPR